MKNGKVSPAKNARLALLASINRALEYHQRAESSFRQGAVFASLSGLEFLHVKGETGHGKWQDFYAEQVESKLPLRTAQYYMQVAEGLKLKARRAADGETTFAPPKADLDAFLLKRQGKRHAGRLVQLTGHFERRFNAEIWRLLETAPSKLTDAQRTRLAAAVESIADGETMASLIEAYRISKKPAGSGVDGGYRPDLAKLAEFLGVYRADLLGTPYEKLPAEVQAHFRKWVAKRENDPAQLAFEFCRPALDLFEHPDFEKSLAYIPDAEAHRMLDHVELIARRLRARFGQAQRKAA